MTSTVPPPSAARASAASKSATTSAAHPRPRAKSAAAAGDHTRPAEAAAYAAARGWGAEVVDDFDAALARAGEGAGTVLVTGSFHTVGDAMARLQVSPLAG